jgi:hypothetical protein
MIIASTGQDVAPSLTFSSMSSGAFSILATATSPCTSKTSGETSTDVSSPTQVSLSTRTYFFLLSIPFTKIWYVRWHLRLKMSTIFFAGEKHPQEDGKAYFLTAHQKPEEKLGKSMRPTMIIRFNGFLLKRGLTGTGQKKPCLV